MIVLATLIALLGATAIQPSYAAQRSIAPNGTSAFDGTWSVVLKTTHGDCAAAVRAGVRILGGRLSAQDQSYELDGRVAPSGAVRVMISAGGQTGDDASKSTAHIHNASAFGQLSREAGRGHWQTSSGECAGEWTAERRD
jgi:hypothetical protein